MSRSPAILFILLLLLPAFAQAELRITGVDRDLERNVRAYTALDDEDCDAEPWRVRRRFRSLEADIRKALQPFGFYAPRITTSLEFAEGCWRATADIVPGDSVTLRNVDIAILGEAANDPEFASLTATGLTPGAGLRHASYDRYKQSLQILAADRGYLDAGFTSSTLDIYPDERVADVTLHYDSGPRYRIGEIRQEQAFLDPRLVTGYLDLEEGSLFDGRELARAYRDLSNSGYFGRIEIVPLHDAATDRQVPIRVALEPGTRIEYTIGIGASTDTGPRLRAGFRNNRLNERGHRLVTDLNVSTGIQGLTAEYRKPLADPRSDWMSYTAALVREDNDTFTNEGVRVGLRRSKRLSTSWIRTLFLDVSYDRYTVGLERDNTTLVLPGLAFDHKYADRDLYPNRGRRLGVELLGTSTALGSNTSFAQVRATARWVRALATGSRVLARARIGATETADFEQLPPSVRFFAGGDESVRGFDYDSLGPTDAEGNVIGGVNLLVASLEFEQRLFGNYYGAVFADAGNAFNDTDFDAAVGTGLGIKWRSPLGPIRVYVGFPLTDEASGARLHLRLGPDL